MYVLDGVRSWRREIQVRGPLLRPVLLLEVDRRSTPSALGDTTILVDARGSIVMTTSIGYMAGRRRRRATGEACHFERGLSRLS